MAISDLIQVDDNTWIDPRTVKSIKHWPERKVLSSDTETAPANTSIAHEDGKYTISHWPIERLKRVLNLPDSTWLHNFWETS